MKTVWGMVRIRRGGLIKEQMVPGVVVGPGLAVTQFPNTDSTGQSAFGLTLAKFGLLLPGEPVYFSWRLAVRCAEELLRVVSFDAPNEKSLRARIGPIWIGLLKPICDRYSHLDDLWEERQVVGASGGTELRMTWDAWARRN